MAACLQAGEADAPCSCGLLRMRHARFFPSLRLPPEGLVLKWQKGGGGENRLVEILISYGSGRKEEERRRRHNLGKVDCVMVILLSFLLSNKTIYVHYSVCRVSIRANYMIILNICACLYIGT